MNAPVLPGQIEHWPEVGLRESFDQAKTAAAQKHHRNY